MDRLTELQIQVRGAETNLTLLEQQDAPEDVLLVSLRRCRELRRKMQELTPDSEYCETVYTVAFVG